MRWLFIAEEGAVSGEVQQRPQELKRSRRPDTHKDSQKTQVPNCSYSGKSGVYIMYQDQGNSCSGTVDYCNLRSRFLIENCRKKRLAP